jgi:hypothetical protein
MRWVKSANSGQPVDGSNGARRPIGLRAGSGSPDARLRGNRARGRSFGEAREIVQCRLQTRRVIFLSYSFGYVRAKGCNFGASRDRSQGRCHLHRTSERRILERDGTPSSIHRRTSACHPEQTSSPGFPNDDNGSVVIAGGLSPCLNSVSRRPPSPSAAGRLVSG